MRILLLAFALMFSACAVGNPSKPIAPTAPASTQSFEDLDWFSVLAHQGALPLGYAGGQLRFSAPNRFSSLPRAVATANLQLWMDGGDAGWVLVMQYVDEAKRAVAYDEMQKTMGRLTPPETAQYDAAPLPEVGERASELWLVFDLDYRSLTEILFERCGLLVHVRMRDQSDRRAVEEYAGLLDSRLERLFC